MKLLHNILFSLVLFFPLSFVSAEFADVDTTHPHFHAITFLEENDIASGYDYNGQKIYRALHPILRSEASKMLVTATGLPVNNELKSKFPDVPDGEWFTPYVMTLNDEGVIRGFEDGTFRPGREVTRAEFLKMALLSFGIEIPEPTGTQSWVDPVFDTGLEYRVVQEGAKSSHTSINRGEVAEIIYRLSTVAQTDFEESYTYAGEGQASYYHDDLIGASTASGEPYDPQAMTCAHRTLPFGTKLKVWYNDQFIVVRVNDRGPYSENRVLDLSKRAFQKLAPLGEGVIDVKYEVFSSPTDKTVAIPEAIAPALSLEVKKDPVPELVAKLIENDGQVPNNYRRRPQAIRPPQPLFDGTVAHLGDTYFPNASLRYPVPQKVKAGTVINFMGTAKNPGHRKINVFLQKVVDKTPVPRQQHFIETLSGNNFSVPVLFAEPGTYHMGMVFDQETSSRLAEIEVVKDFDRSREPHLTFAQTPFASELSVNVVPEEKYVLFEWQSGNLRLTKLVFTQNNKTFPLYLENGLDSIRLPFDFFIRFHNDAALSVDMFQALSEDGTLAKQNTQWQSVDFMNFRLISGFQDYEAEDITVFDYPRFAHDLNQRVITGSVTDRATELAEHAYLITPEGSVREFSITTQANGQFSVTIRPDVFGAHVFELVSTEGEILFNRGFYVSEDFVLPVMPWSQTRAASNSLPSLRNWTNYVRQKHGQPVLHPDVDLDAFAQSYADLMATRNFISHTTPEGVTLEMRVRQAGLEGEFGENLSYGSTLDLALQGLENSASHRQSLLAPKWNRLGIGYAENAKGEVYFVQVFGR